MCVYSYMYEGVLLYFVEGVLPLLRDFFGNIFSPPASGEDRDLQLRITDRLLSNLLVGLSLYSQGRVTVCVSHRLSVTLSCCTSPMRTRSGSTGAQ